MTPADYISAATRTRLLEVLAEKGIASTDEDGAARIPKQFGQATSTNNVSAVFLGKIELVPATFDADGKQITPPVISDRWHANVVPNGQTWPAGITTHQPETPFSVIS